MGLLSVFAIFTFVYVQMTTADWRETGNYYQVYPRSFKDSDGDGIGDLKGVKEKLQYLKDLGMEGVWLSPIFKSPMVDFGYDISDFYAIQPEYGTMQDFDELLAECKKIGIKLIMDFVPNHTSDEHEWFQKSLAGDPEYKDYFIWHPGKENPAGGRPLPPSNWISAFRGSAWEWSDERQEYYLHQFATKQVDLNFRNPKVVQAMKDVMKWWLDKGIAGLRIDSVPFMFEVLPNENNELPDEPPSGKCTDPEAECYLNHIYTQHQPESWEMVYQWRELTDSYKDDPKVLLIEAYTALENIMKLYGDGQGRDGGHIPFNFELLRGLTINSNAADVKYYIDRWFQQLPAGRSSNWVIGNHDNPRPATRLGEGRADVFNIMVQTLPGNAVTYQGEELVMTDGEVSWEETVDPQGVNAGEALYKQYSRDPCRTPFQWDDSKNSGFSSANKPWLPLAKNYTIVNVKAQEAAERSHLKIFRTLTSLRKTDKAFELGSVDVRLINNDVLGYLRKYNDQVRLIVLNFSANNYTIDLTDTFCKVNTKLTLLVSSLNTNLKDG